jgi:hypothetical protein
MHGKGVHSPPVTIKEAKHQIDNIGRINFMVDLPSKSVVLTPQKCTVINGICSPDKGQPL